MAGKSEWLKWNGHLQDGGPVYTETDPTEFIVEPWNALSSLAFLIPAFYWAWVCRYTIRQHSFLLYCCCLLALGGLGSTLFHAFRKFPALLLMDVLPIVILTMSVSIFFWVKVLPKWWLVFPILLPPMYARIWMMDNLPAHEAINIGYFISGVMIFLPLMFLLIRNKFTDLVKILLALFFLSIALYCRRIDADTPPLLEVGTHWLWHLFCATGAYYLGSFVYSLELSKSKSAV